MLELFQSVKPKRVTEEIIEQLLALIREGKIRPGERLPSERELAATLEVSRPSLREALKRLEYNGVLRTVQGSGTYLEDVAGPSLRDPLKEIIQGDSSAVADLAEFRGAIESWAAGMAALRADETHMEDLRNIVDSMKKGLDKREPIHKLDANFHLTIAKASKNMIYLQVGTTIFFLYSEMARLYSEKALYSTKSELERVYEEHVAILQAIEKRDCKAAEKLMRKHLLRPAKWFREHLASK